MTFDVLRILIPGVLFLIWVLWCGSKLTPFRFGAAVFAFLSLTKLEVFLYPPYGDSASGPFMEAVWLLHHNFDYLALSKEPLFIYGGPKVYLFSIYPTFEALLMKLIPDSKIFLIINHLIVFIWGAVSVTYVYKIARQIMEDRIAMLVAILFMSLPLFHSQVEILNMEMPLTMFSILSIYFVTQRKWAMASLMAMMAIFVPAVAVTIWAEAAGNPALLKAGADGGHVGVRVVRHRCASGFVIRQTLMSPAAAPTCRKSG